MEKSLFVDLSIVDEVPVRKMKDKGIDRNKILVDILVDIILKEGLA